MDKAIDLNTRRVMSHEPLPAPRISSCPMRWEEMAGDERKRFCTHCSLHVHNLSAMPPREAKALVEGAEAAGERLCVAYFADDNGNVMARADAGNGSAPLATPPHPARQYAPTIPVPRWSIPALLASLAAGAASLLTGCASTPPVAVTEEAPYTLPAVGDIPAMSVTTTPPWQASGSNGGPSTTGARPYPRPPSTRLSSAPPPIHSSAPPNGTRSASDSPGQAEPGSTFVMDVGAVATSDRKSP